LTAEPAAAEAAAWSSEPAAAATRSAESAATRSAESAAVVPAAVTTLLLVALLGNTGLELVLR
jgi:hypothetical protein